MNQGKPGGGAARLSLSHTQSAMWQQGLKLSGAMWLAIAIPITIAVVIIVCIYSHRCFS